MMAPTNNAPSHWLAEMPASFKPTELPSETEVAIIGGGIMGVSTTYWLARLGIRPLLLEARQLAWGASGRNAGLMLAGSRPLEDPKLVKTVLQEENINAGYTRPGHLALASSETIWEKICQEAARRQHTPDPVYALSPSECEALLCMRLRKRFYGGRWLPGGGMVHPVRLVQELAKAAQRHGASLFTQTEVSCVRGVAGRDCFALRTTRGTLRAHQVVFACSAQLPKFIAGFEKIMMPVRGQVLSTSPLPSLFRVGLAVDWGTVYWRQTDSGAIILGGYRGLDPQTETGDQACLNPHIQEALSSFLPDTFPDFPPFSIEKRWAGIMDYAIDEQPIIGARPHIPNQWVIAGFGGHGLPAALGAAKALAEAIATGREPAVLEPFNPGRFATSI